MGGKINNKRVNEKKSKKMYQKDVQKERTENRHVRKEKEKERNRREREKKNKLRIIMNQQRDR